MKEMMMKKMTKKRRRKGQGHRALWASWAPGPRSILMGCHANARAREQLRRRRRTGWLVSGRYTG